MIKTNLANNLYSLRKEYNISKSTLGKSIGVTRQAIHSYESGSAMPSVEVLLKISDFFDCTIDYLLFSDKNSENIEEFTYSAIEKLLKSKQELLAKKATIEKSIIEIDKSVDEIDRSIKILKKANEMNNSNRQKD